MQLALAEQFQGPVLVGRRGQPERGLLFQHQRHGGPDVPAHRFAGRAVELQAIVGGGHRGDRGHGLLAAGGTGELHAEQVAAEIDVALDVDFVVRALADQLGPLRPQKLAGPHVGQPGKPVPQSEVFGLFDFRAARAGRHDGDPPVSRSLLPGGTIASHSTREPRAFRLIRSESAVLSKVDLPEILARG